MAKMGMSASRMQVQSINPTMSALMIERSVRRKRGAGGPCQGSGGACMAALAPSVKLLVFQHGRAWRDGIIRDETWHYSSLRSDELDSNGADFAQPGQLSDGRAGGKTSAGGGDCHWRSMRCPLF